MNNNESTSSHNMISPLPFSTMTNGIDLSSDNLFPTLSHVNNDDDTTMDTLPPLVPMEEQNVHM
jgi:hypothetical protein